MGHSRETTFDCYYSQAVYLDTQSGFLNTPMQQQLINKTNTISAHRDLRAPKPAYASLAKTAVQNWTGQKCERGDKAFVKKYFQYFEEQARADTIAQLALSDDNPTSDSTSTDRRTREPSRLFRVVLRYHPARARVTATFFPPIGLPNPQMTPAVECLFRFAQDRERLSGYPGVPPLAKNNGCPTCKVSFDSPGWSHNQIRVNAHVLKCYTSHLKEQSRVDLWRVCLWESCSEYLKTTFGPEDMADHNSLHLNEIAHQSGVIQCRWRGCDHSSTGFEPLVAHLRHQHCFYSGETAPDPFYCRECTKWFYCVLDWEQHCQDHLD